MDKIPNPELGKTKSRIGLNSRIDKIPNPELDKIPN